MGVDPGKWFVTTFASRRKRPGETETAVDASPAAVTYRAALNEPIRVG